MIEVEHNPSGSERVTIRLAGEIEASDVLGLRQVLSGVSNGQLVIDLTDVVFLDHAGIGAIAAAAWRSTGEATRTCLVCPRPGLLQVLRDARILETVDVVATGTDRLTKR